MECCTKNNNKSSEHTEHEVAHEDNQSKHSHSGCGDHGSSEGWTDSAANFLRRFWIVTVLLIPLVLTNEMTAGLLGIGDVITYAKWIGFITATVIFGFALIFFQHASHEIRSGKYGMMTLVSLAVGSGYLFSVASTFLPALEVEFYLEISTLIWVLLFGHYLEAKSSVAAGDALEEVSKLLPSTARVFVDGEEKTVQIESLKVGDIVLVKPGEKIPADGTVSEGGASVDESLISGESKPISKKQGDKVTAGSICVDGALTITLARVGEHSTVGQIKQLIKDARATKPRSQKIADRAAGILTFVALIAAIITLLVWFLLMGESFVFGITLAITVLVIACPHALGLAIPAVTTITATLTAKNGIFIKNMAKIETIKKAGYVIFDKTGTLTKGEFGVTSVSSVTGMSEDELLRIAASLEQHSSHIIGLSIVKHAKKLSANLVEPKQFKNFAGKGVSGTIDGQEYHIENSTLMRDIGVEDGDMARHDKQDRAETQIFISKDKKIIGVIYLADEIKKEAFDAVRKLHDMSVKVAMLTGDRKNVARSVANELKIDTYFAEVLPEDKYKYIRSLQEKRNPVIRVGDGVNDPPALTQADVGVAIGAGTDIALEAGDVILTRNNPEDIARLIFLGRAVKSKMVQNLLWALGYNVVAIPAAAGAFAAWGFFLRPEIGALLMSASTVIVVINALSLKKIKLG